MTDPRITAFTHADPDREEPIEPYPYANALLPRRRRWLNYTTIFCGLILGLWLLAIIFGK